MDGICLAVAGNVYGLDRNGAFAAIAKLMRHAVRPRRRPGPSYAPLRNAATIQSMESCASNKSNFALNPKAKSIRGLRAVGAILAAIAVTACSGTGPQSETGLLKAGDAAMASGDSRSAAEFYRKASLAAPADFAPYDRLGDALTKSGAILPAFEAYRAALSHNPDDASTDGKLGKIALKLGKPEEAVTYYEAAKRKRPDDPRIWNGLGVAHDSIGDHVSAQQDYGAALKLAPNDLSIRNNYGLSQALSGDYRAAIATLSAVASDPRSTARYRQNLALAYGLSGDNVNASIAARKDLNDADSASNQRYYAILRGMDDRARTKAIMGVDTDGGAPQGGH